MKHEGPLAGPFDECGQAGDGYEQPVFVPQSRHV
jgi:hypothetical protein